MSIRTRGFSQMVLVCSVVFMAGGAIAAEGQQEDVNDGGWLIAKIEQLESKIRVQEDVIRRAGERISELENKLAEQTEQNNHLRALCDKAGIKTTAATDANSDANLAPDEGKDALRVERLQKKVKEMNDAIELDEKRIEKLPAIPQRFLELRHRDGRRTYYGYYRLHQGEADEIRKALDTANEKLKLLADEEHNYNQILYYAAKHTDLGIDVLVVKKKLIECQGRKDEAQSVQDRLRDVINANRDKFNIMTG